MQTFLPFDSFDKCAKVLDNKRLNKQIVEAYQIYTGRVPNKNHPACLMWQGLLPWLKEYIKAMHSEYVLRFNKTHAVYNKIESDNECEGTFCIPDKLKISHCVNLIRKGVASDILTAELKHLLAKNGYPNVPVHNFPDAYWWPIEPVGKKANADNVKWESFFHVLECVKQGELSGNIIIPLPTGYLERSNTRTQSIIAELKPNWMYTFELPFINDAYSVYTRGDIQVLEKTPNYIRVYYKGKPKMFTIVGRW